jgi:hypothetical protein
MLSSCRSAFARFQFAASSASCCRPLSNQLSRCTRTDLTFEDAPIEIDHGILTVILGVEMWWSVIVEVHANDDPEKRGDDRH